MRLRAAKLKSSQGLTLIELLVTMVIVGFIMVIMSSALSQVSQIVRVSQELDAQFLPRWREARLFEELIANMVLDPKVEKPFVGDFEKISMSSVAVPTSDQGYAQPIILSLQKSSNGQIELILEPAVKEFAAKSESIVVTRLMSDASFVYLDSQNQEHLVWPPIQAVRSQDVAVDTMPSGVLIKERSGDRRILLTAAFLGRTNQEGKNNLSRALLGGGG